MYRITETNDNVFPGEQFSTEIYRGIAAYSDERMSDMDKRFQKLLPKCVHKFRCCDDDGDWYFKGISTSCDDEDAVAPLDDIGEAYGCTYIEYWNEKTHEWEVL